MRRLSSSGGWSHDKATKAGQVSGGEARADTGNGSQMGARVEVDEGRRPGVSTDERERLKELERENRELRRANEILKSASAFFAAELDGRKASTRDAYRRDLEAFTAWAGADTPDDTAELTAKVAYLATELRVSEARCACWRPDRNADDAGRRTHD